MLWPQGTGKACRYPRRNQGIGRSVVYRLGILAGMYPWDPWVKGRSITLQSLAIQWRISNSAKKGCQMQAMCLKRELQTPGKRAYRDDSDGAKVSENPPVCR